MQKHLRSGTWLGLIFAVAIGLAELRAAPADLNPETYTFKRIGNLEIKADVYRRPGTQVRPVVVWIHGGALIMGGRQRPERRLQQLVDAGAVMVSIDYRLAPEAKLPAIVSDVEDAIDWIRKKGLELFQADRDRIVIWGNSAGGYLTLTAGYRVMPRVQALVSLFGYGEVIGEWYSKPSPHARHWKTSVSKSEARSLVSGAPVANGNDRPGPGNAFKAGNFYHYCRQQGIWPYEVTGWDPIREAERFHPYMPLKNVSADYPPTFLLHGTADTDVPFQQSAAMAAELRARGVPHTLIALDGGEHGFAGAAPEKIEAAFAAAIDFTKKHLGIK